MRRINLPCCTAADRDDSPETRRLEDIRVHCAQVQPIHFGHPARLCATASWRTGRFIHFKHAAAIRATRPEHQITRHCTAPQRLCVSRIHTSLLPDFEKEASDSFCSLQLHLQYGDEKTWQKTMAVRIALTEVEGKRYRIDVVPRGSKSSTRSQAKWSKPQRASLSRSRFTCERRYQSSTRRQRSMIQVFWLCVSTKAASATGFWWANSSSASASAPCRAPTTIVGGSLARRRGFWLFGQASYASRPSDSRPTARPSQRRACTASKAVAAYL